MIGFSIIIFLIKLQKDLTTFENKVKLSVSLRFLTSSCPLATLHQPLSSSLYLRTNSLLHVMLYKPSVIGLGLSAFLLDVILCKKC